MDHHRITYLVMAISYLFKALAEAVSEGRISPGKLFTPDFVVGLTPGRGRDFKGDAHDRQTPVLMVIQDSQ